MVAITNSARLSGKESALETAIQQYMERKTDLRDGAALAGVSYNRFIQEVEARNIVVLEADRFVERLEGLADMFGDADLQETILKLHASAQ